MKVHQKGDATTSYPFKALNRKSVKANQRGIRIQFQNQILVSDMVKGGKERGQECYSEMW